MKRTQEHLEPRKALLPAFTGRHHRRESLVLAGHRIIHAACALDIKDEPKRFENLSTEELEGAGAQIVRILADRGVR